MGDTIVMAGQPASRGYRGEAQAWARQSYRGPFIDMLLRPPQVSLSDKESQADVTYSSLVPRVTAAAGDPSEHVVLTRRKDTFHLSRAYVLDPGRCLRPVC